MNYKIEIVVPLYGDCTNNLYNLINSVKEQELGNWHIHLAADLVNKETKSECQLWDTLDQRITYYPNRQNKRMHALKNICRVLDGLENKKETIIGIVDGDDQLMDSRAFNWVCEEYKKGYGVVWTKNIWDQYNINNSFFSDYNYVLVFCLFIIFIFTCIHSLLGHSLLGHFKIVSEAI